MGDPSVSRENVRSEKDLAGLIGEIERGRRTRQVFIERALALGLSITGVLSKLEAGAAGYDVICPSDQMVHIMIRTGLLEPPDADYIPSFQNVDPEFQDPTCD